MYRSLLSLGLLASPAFAFVNTAPLVAWSSSSSKGLTELASAGPIVAFSQALSAALGNDLGDDLCQSKVLVISQEDLHAEDLASLSLLASSLPSAALRIPYLTSPSLSALDGALAELVAVCSSDDSIKTVVVRQAGESLDGLWAEHDGFELVKVVLGREEELEGESRTDRLRWEDSLIAPQIQDLLATSAPHVILLTGHASPQTLLAVQQQQRRQETPFQSSAASAYAPSSPSNKTREGAEAELPLLARYQLISTPVLMMTLLSLLVLLPILGLGIMALASIQVPPRMDHVKGIQVGVTLDKKNQ